MYAWNNVQRRERLETRQQRRQLSLFVLSVLVATASRGQMVVRVGSSGDEACDFTSVAAAYASIPDSQVEAEIRVAVNYPGGEEIQVRNLAARAEGFELRLVGGYETSASSTSGPFPTVVVGNGVSGTSPLFLIRADGPAAGKRTIHLKDLTLRDHTIGGDGAGINATAGSIRLERVSFVRLKARHGGAMFLSATAEPGWIPEVEVVTSAKIQNSRALGPTASGGALFCVGTDGARPAVRGGELLLIRNIALPSAGLSRGGAARLLDCDLEVEALVASDNRASVGGAFALEGDSTLVVSSPRLRTFLDMDHLKFFGFNRAVTTDGGAIFAIDRSRVRIAGARFEGNRAASRGGAIWAVGEATVELGCEYVGKGCRAGGSPVTVFDDNVAASDGGAIWTAADAVVRVSRGVLRSNDAPAGAAVYQSGRSEVSLLGVVLDRNGDGGSAGHPLGTSEVLFSGGTEAARPFTIAHATSVGHREVGALISVAGETTVRVRNSIFGEKSGTTVFGDPSSSRLDLDDPCFVSSTSAGLPAETSGWERVASPENVGFVDLAEGNGRLRPSSPAVNRCVTIAGASLDLDGEIRSRVGEGPTPVDVGADEFVAAALGLCAAFGRSGERFPMTVTGSGFVGDVNVSVEMLNDEDEDVSLWLESPRGTVVELDRLVSTSREVELYDDEAFVVGQPREVVPIDLLARFDGEPMAGEWSLLAEIPFPEILVEQWCIRFTGGAQASMFTDGFESGDISAWR